MSSWGTSWGTSWGISWGAIASHEKDEEYLLLPFSRGAVLRLETERVVLIGRSMAGEDVLMDLRYSNSEEIEAILGGRDVQLPLECNREELRSEAVALEVGILLRATHSVSLDLTYKEL